MSARVPSNLDLCVQQAARAASQTRAPQWAGLRVELPVCDSLAVFEALASSDWPDSLDRFYWERPAEGRALVGHGCVAAVEVADEPDGTTRFDQASNRAHEIFASLHIAGDAAAPEAGPALVGGFAFSSAPSTEAHWNEFPNSRLVLPRVTVATVGGRSWCTILRTLQPGDDAHATSEGLKEDLADFERCLQTEGVERGMRSFGSGMDHLTAYRAVGDRSHAEYCGQVVDALHSIADGEFEKVVLARSVSLVREQSREPGREQARGHGREPDSKDRRESFPTDCREDDCREDGFDLCALLDALRRTHPGCAIFAIGRPASTFLGATPECLVRLRDRQMETASLAGSAPRGRSPEEDSLLGRELLESKKEQAEHAVVVRALRAALDPHCETLDIPESPRLMRLQDIQHLETPVTGRVRDDTSILDLLRDVHPTPAVAGEPREAALAWLADHESLDRGWYAGPVGFVDSRGGGEFFAALRSSLLTGDEARLFAGAGIVEGSQPERELCETRLKLQTMLSPLFEI